MSVEERLLSLIGDLFSNAPSLTLVFSKASEGSPKKQKGRLCQKNGERILSIEAEYDFGRVAQRNLRAEELSGAIAELIPCYSQINIITEGAEAEYKRSKKGSSVIIGENKTRNAVGNTEKTVALELNRKKSYALSGGEPFLYHLGISDKNGRVHDKRQAKFRQINHFTEALENVYYALPEDGKIVVFDLCCGKSYLSFAVYHYLTEIKGREVYMLGVDQRGEVIDFCNEIARLSGFSGMEFICDDVKNTPKDIHPNLLISLHACDIATDVVLDSGIALGADVILSTPCCHRYLNDKIKVKELSFVTSHPQIRNKLCEAITDGLRALRLRAAGYSVTLTELTDPENTPKNTLIRAIKSKSFDKDSPRAKKLAEDYNTALSFILGDNAENYLKEIK